AVFRAGRLLLPAKMTSSIPAARIALCDASPITQRNASTRFDLPQPFGPTTPVRPGSMRKSAGSTQDLKPIRRNRLSFIDDLPRADRASGLPCEIGLWSRATAGRINGQAAHS